MPQLSRLSGWFLGLMLTCGSLAGWAQADQADDDSVVAVSRPARPTSEVARLKAALGPARGSARGADSLLAEARRLNYAPGQVVALSQLASIRLQQQQPQQAQALLREAEKLAPQLRDLGEAGWALGQVGRIKGRAARATRGTADAGEYYEPLFEALGEAMSTAGNALKNRKLAKIEDLSRNRKLQKLAELDGVDFNPFAAGAATDKRQGRGRTAPNPPRPADDYGEASAAGYRAAQPANGATEQQYARLRLGRLDQIDQWLDTLLTRGSNPPQVVRQLKAQRKRRDSSQALSQAYAQEGDYAQAYRYFLQYSAYKDSLTAEATTRRLAALEYKQTLLKKEAQIQRLTKERLLRERAARRQQQFVLGLGSCVALLMGFSVVLGRNNRAKQLANQQLSEQKETLQRTLAELETAQTQLIQAEKMASLGELTAGIAHEIQNPLNFVNNFSEVSTELVHELREARQQDPRDPDLEEELLDDVQQNLQKISQHGNRASAIVRGMLEHARTSSSQKEPTDLNALIEEYLKLAYHGARAKDNSFKAQLTTDLDPRLGPVPVVPQEVSRVLMNLFSNAFYAVRKRQSDPGPGYQPEVRVSTKREANQVKIQVRDNGTGVPAALQQKVFQPFFTTKPTGQGTGLGLSLSYDIITKGHGGTFTLESEEGQFTELTLTLPISAS